MCRDWKYLASTEVAKGWNGISPVGVEVAEDRDWTLWQPETVVRSCIVDQITNRSKPLVLLHKVLN